MPTKSTKKAAAKKAAAPKAPKAPKVANKCGCGCGGETFREFLPGHDAKLKSRLVNTAVDPSSTPAQIATAEKDLAARNWTHFLVKRQELVGRKAEAAAKRQEAKDATAKAKAEKAAAKKAAAASKKASGSTKKAAKAA